MPPIGGLTVMDHGIYGHILIVVGVEPPQKGKKVPAAYLAQGNIQRYRNKIGFVLC
ncbi:hypothetical protein KSX_85810 [Ktedonospora formicarum]|uniref:Uncharacterized protein n=1 Tax=Ktedonospora formicarum TaxID=2778364 RepID=A0A8J3IDQ5_9CHLR|nr:hypothetical protein KSX_85810 [Ktedonospora formicarum]